MWGRCASACCRPWSGWWRSTVGETVALVAHGGTNRVILFEALGMDLARFHALAQDYACVNRLEYFPDGNTVVKLVNG